MHITVNGKPRDIESEPGGTPLPAFLQACDIDRRLVAVAINGDVIPKAQYDQARIRDGDQVEVVRMVGGGAR
jgi:sulfur carrier protein